MTNRDVENLAIQLVPDHEHAAGRRATDSPGRGALVDIEGDWIIEIKAFGRTARGADPWAKRAEQMRRSPTPAGSTW